MGSACTKSETDEGIIRDEQRAVSPQEDIKEEIKNGKVFTDTVHVNNYF